MGLTTLSVSVLPLIGVVLGTTGTLLSQYLVGQREAARESDRRKADSRSERKQAIIGFLDAAQRVEQLLDGRNHGRPQDEIKVDELLHALWLSKKVVELVCHTDLAPSVHLYTAALHALVSDEQTEELIAAKREYRASFQDAARRDLGVTGPPHLKGPIRDHLAANESRRQGE